MIEKKNYRKLYTVLSYLGVFTFCTRILICLACIVASFVLCVIVVGLAVFIVVVVLCGCCYLMYICCTMCALLFFTLDAGLLANVSIRKVLRPTTSTQVFLGFPVSISKC